MAPFCSRREEFQIYSSIDQDVAKVSQSRVGLRIYVLVCMAVYVNIYVGATANDAVDVGPRFSWQSDIIESHKVSARIKEY